MTAPAKPENEPSEKPYSKEHLERVYTEASQWVRLVNTIIWSMGTLLVPVSFGFVGLALNASPGAPFEWRRKLVLGIGSVCIFSFWVYASRLYKLSTEVARQVLVNIEAQWQIDQEKTALFTLQDPILKRHVSFLGKEIPYGLFPSQLVILGTLVLVWVVILALHE